MFDGVEHVAIASPSPAALAQWYVDHLAFRLIHLIQRAHPLPE
jgi:catechol 2,3-dioxygenase-like lactoylglutathione lyase family enzyme